MKHRNHEAAEKIPAPYFPKENALRKSLMNIEKLREETEIELKNMQATLAELKALVTRLQGSEPTTIEKAGAGACLGQLYAGLERILLRICKHLKVPLPSGSDWHVSLFRMFCNPPANNLPLLFDEELERALIAYRNFRHVFVHGYGIMMDWSRMIGGIRSAEVVFRTIEQRIRRYLDNLQQNP